MTTLRLEIISSNNPYNIGFYNPSSDECKAYPRTEAGTSRAMNKFMSWIESKREALGITGARILVYEGKQEYYNDAKCVAIIPIF